MQKPRASKWKRALSVLAALLILKVTANVVLGYRDYFPPNFESDFLQGRQSYFAGVYRWAFYAHVASGPISLVLGMILISEAYRTRFPRAHRTLGKIETSLVLFLLAPSGLWMAYYSQTGATAAMGFSALAIGTGMCVGLGWRSAVQKRFAEHRRWMSRCFLLLCSAVVLRLIGGLATVTDVGGDWSYPLAAWASWLVPLAAFELSCAYHRRRMHAGIPHDDQSASTSAALSLPAMEISARR